MTWPPVLGRFTIVSVEFLLTSLIVCVMPGTGVVFTLAAGLSRGPAGGLLGAFACTLGVLPHVVAALTGLTALLQASPMAFQVLRYLGVAYLLYMAVSMLLGRSTLTVREEEDHRGAGRVVLAAVLINVLNPKLTLFFLAFLPQFVPMGEADVVLRMAGLSAVFLLLTFLVLLGYGLLAGSFRALLTARPGVLVWTQRCFAVLFAALAVQLITH